MTPYIEKNLAKDEEISVMGNKNKLAIIGIWAIPTIMLLIIIAAFIIIGILNKKADGIGDLILTQTSVVWIIAAIWFLSTIGAIKKTVLFFAQEAAITTRRVAYKEGFFKTYTRDVPLEQIVNVNVLHPFFGKLFNYSTFNVKLDTFDYLEIKYLKNAEKFKVEVTSQIEALNEKRARMQAELQAAEIAKFVNASKDIKE